MKTNFKFKIQLIAFIFALSITSCKDLQDSKIKTKNNIDSIEVVTTIGDTVVIFSGNYTIIAKKNFRK